MSARTGGLFNTERECQKVVSQEMLVIAKGIKAVARAKCFKVGQAT
tara:strand:- start:713 stop:850 length:138 start_codon:yes stop_codon:yes gene_type:complete